MNKIFLILIIIFCSFSFASYAAPVPVGAVEMYVSSNIPAGWLLCNGSAISRTTYAKLFALIGTTYGTGDGSTTFNLPDFRGVFPKGAGTTSRTAGVDANGNYYAATLGTYYQDKMQGHKHSINSSGSHSHALTDNSNSVRFVDADTTRGSYGDISRGATNIAGIMSAVISSEPHTHTASDFAASLSADGTNSTPRTGMTTEPQSLGINFIIKY